MYFAAVDKEKHTILIAPLDWGLGHATRCIPLIRNYISEGHRVILAAYGQSGLLLEKEFPDLKMIHFPGIEISYPKGKSMHLKMFLQIPKIIRSISREHLALQKLIDQENITLVVSDNRYGLYSKKVPCIFITHQLFIRAGIWSKMINRINHAFISRYTTCYIPDYEIGNTLSGELSHGQHRLKNIRYIGPLSRFSGADKKEHKCIYDVLLLISGPEPQRTLFEKHLSEQFSGKNLRYAVVRGSSSEQKFPFKHAIKIIDLCSSNELLELMLNSEKIICRSGYSTIMDLHVLEKKAEYIPTPGQTEQEYLAAYHSQNRRM